MKLKRLIFLVVGIFFCLTVYSQQVKIEASNKSLSYILIQVRNNYNVNFSFNDLELSKYTITVSRTFSNVDLALKYLLKGLPFEFEKAYGVYVIFPKKKQELKKPKPKIYRITGRIIEAETNELLPFSNILINSTGIISDHNGNFLFSTQKDSVFRIRVSHLGYLIKDTIFYRAHKNVVIKLW